jgi:ATP-dependent DNA helicase RecQ
MEFLARELNDPTAEPCGRCANCRGKGLPATFSQELAEEACAFLENAEVLIEPRCSWPNGHGFEGRRGKIRPELRIECGRALSRWGQSGWAQLVKDGKQRAGRFSDRLVNASATLIRMQWNPQPTPTWLTCVPSTRHLTLVPDLAQRLSSELQIPFVACIHKVCETVPQKTRCTSVQQVHNLEGAFDIDRNTVMPGAVLLVDDMVDSRWTLTVLGLKLREAGSGPVFPFALADASCSARDW